MINRPLKELKSSNKKHGTGCPIAFGLNAFGDRWTLLIVRGLLIRGNRTFGELLEAEEGISSNILTNRLKSLESEGLVGRTPSPQNRRSNFYYLTQKGAELAPVLLAIIRWSAAHDQKGIAKTDIVRQAEANPDEFAEELIGKQRALRNSLDAE